MSVCINKVTLIGYLGKDLEQKTVGSTIVTNFTLATTNSFLDKSGAKKDVTEWHNIAFWGNNPAFKWLKKGSLAYIEGRIQSSTWSDAQGNRKTSYGIVASQVTSLSTKKDAQQEIPSYQNREPDYPTLSPLENVGGMQETDDLPF